MAEPDAFDREALRRELVRDEGLRHLPYLDSEGYWTIGVGIMIDERRGGGLTAEEVMEMMSSEKPIPVISGYAGEVRQGSSRLISYQDATEWFKGGLPLAGIMLLLDRRIDRAAGDLDRYEPWWCTLSPSRQRVLINMCFNLGISRLLDFKLALAAMKAGKFHLAAAEMLDSKWAKQVGERAERLAVMMKEG